MTFTNAQSFDVDTLRYNGDPSKYINFVLMGDGFTATEQTKFLTEANKITDSLFTIVPWSNYRNYFNVFAIKVLSSSQNFNHRNLGRLNTS